MPTADEDLARARLAYISAGRRPLSAPRRAVSEETAPGVAEPLAHEPATGIGAGAGLAWLADPALRRRYVAAVLVLLLVGIGITVAVLGRSQASQVEIATPPTQVQVSEPSPPPTSESPEVSIRVHVLGAVEHPGVVTLTDGAIVADAVDAAGGLRPDADPAELNLAARLSDGQQLVVGTTAEPRGDIRDQPGNPAGGSDAPGGPVNLNTASAAGLESLPGVGPVMAAAIITWREDNGGFRTVADLQEVPGVGPKTFATLEPLVTV